MENYNDNNIVEIGGKVVTELEFSHEIYEEKFYRFYVETKRMSDYTDKLPIIISERLVNIGDIKIGEIVHVEGQFRSYNQIIEGKSKLVLSIFAKDIELVQDESILTLNDATFIGFICKKPIYRKTPLGREIADVLLAVNRTYKKSDYIPCILWGRNAKFCEKVEVGTRLKLNGRIQSRNYEKKLEDGTVIPKVAYEVSIAKLSVDRADESDLKSENV